MSLLKSIYKRRFFNHLVKDNIFNTILFFDNISFFKGQEILYLLKNVYENLNQLVFTGQVEDNSNIHILCHLFDSLSPLIKSEIIKHTRNLILANNSPTRDETIILNILEVSFYLDWLRDIGLIEKLLTDRNNPIKLRRIAAKNLATSKIDTSEIWKSKLEKEYDPNILCFGFLAINKVNKIEAFQYMQNNQIILRNLDSIKLNIYNSLVDLKANSKIVEIIANYPEELQSYFKEIIFNDEDLNILKQKLTDRFKRSSFNVISNWADLNPFLKSNDIREIILLDNLPKYDIKTVKQVIPDLRLIQFAEEKGFFKKFNINISYLNDEKKYTGKSTIEIIKELYLGKNTDYGLISLPPITIEDIKKTIKKGEVTHSYDIFVQNIYVGFSVWGYKGSEKFDRNNPEASFKKVIKNLSEASGERKQIRGLDSGSYMFIKLLYKINNFLYGSETYSDIEIFIDNNEENYSSNRLLIALNEGFKDGRCKYIVGSAITNYCAWKEHFTEVISSRDLIYFLDFLKSTDLDKITYEINDFLRMTQLFNSWNLNINNGTTKAENQELVKRIFGIARYTVNYILERKNEFYDFLFNSWDPNITHLVLNREEIIEMFEKYYIFPGNEDYGNFFSNSSLQVEQGRLIDLNYERNFELQEGLKDSTPFAKDIYLHIKDDKTLFDKKFKEFESEFFNGKERSEYDKKIYRSLVFFRNNEFFKIGQDQLKKIKLAQ